MDNSKNRVWFVSRHSGAKEWFLYKNFHKQWNVTDYVPHIDIDNVSEGDTVIGSLPLQMVARLCSLNVAYWHIVIDLEEAKRGEELSCRDMIKANARLERYIVRSYPTCQ